MARLPRIQSQVALATRYRVSGWSEGAHSSVHAGRSLEFHDVREYVRGDDVADIDWKASARRGSLLVKRHVAERRTTLLIAAATGRSMAAMASPTARKSDLLVEAAATLAALALGHGDYIGTLHWNDGATAGGRPSTRAVQVEQLLAGLDAACRLDADDADLPRLLDATATALRRRSVVAVLCGDVEIDGELEARLRRLVAQHEVMLVAVPDLDPTADVGTVVGIHDRRRLPRELLRDRHLREAWRADCAERAARRNAALARLSISSLLLNPEQDVVGQVLTLVRGMRRAA
ncbi:DUF58 domain-containing protein [Tessaracoccus massiliensis]|uniref:DUF58 domain-containing protein n=1 Tax=Tessaracoccus massiliensis TaxID=1522311 RepID=UPI00058D541D|nr:DUF58 domain-containing protein [Tessaracoccus massiliensis]